LVTTNSAFSKIAVISSSRSSKLEGNAELLQHFIIGKKFEWLRNGSIRATASLLNDQSVQEAAKRGIGKLLKPPIFFALQPPFHLTGMGFWPRNRYQSRDPGIIDLKSVTQSAENIVFGHWLDSFVGKQKQNRERDALRSFFQRCLRGTSSARVEFISIPA
jgi:hypothetical protein